MNNSTASGPFSTINGFLGAGLRSVKTNPMVWSAVLAVAGAACLAAKSAHLGTVLLSAIGILWMWQDMMDEAVTAPHGRGAALPIEDAPLLALHK
ncbi:hypothetical protein [Roseococcus sp.]|uniref:hypothetical protein n=1 Tax=Roseococcus sp. TaxID=2109646 RepID=UPI003BAB12CA